MASFPFVGIERQTVTYRDAKGNTARMTFFINQNGAGAAPVQTLALNVVTAIDALTNAALQSAMGPYDVLGVAQYGAAPADFQTAENKARLTYQDASGGIHRLSIPAPILAMFLPDHQTVDPANSALVTLNGLLTSASAPASGTPYVSTRNGLFLANYLGGVFAQTKLRRKLTILVLNAELDPSQPAE